jgi:hypothetical protein
VYASISLADFFEKPKTDIIVNDFNVTEIKNADNKTLEILVEDGIPKSKGVSSNQGKFLDLVWFSLFFPLAFIVNCLW